MLLDSPSYVRYAERVFPARLTEASDENELGEWRYGWVQQEHSPYNGEYRDAEPALSGSTAINYATHVRGEQIAVGSLVWMRLKGSVGQQQVYEFDCPPQEPPIPYVVDSSIGNSLFGTSHVVFDPTPVEPLLAQFAEGDMVFLAIKATYDGGVLTAPDGWTELYSGNVGGSNNGNYWIGYHFKTAGTIGLSYTFTTETDTETNYWILIIRNAGVPTRSATASGTSLVPYVPRLYGIPTHSLLLTWSIADAQIPSAPEAAEHGDYLLHDTIQPFDVNGYLYGTMAVRHNVYPPAGQQSFRYVPLATMSAETGPVPDEWATFIVAIPPAQVASSAPAATTNVSAQITVGTTPVLSSSTGYLLSVTSGILSQIDPLDVVLDGVIAGIAQGQSDDLDTISALSSTGILARTGSGTYALRTLTGPAAGITVSNGDGVLGNPTLALANDLAAIEALSGTDTIYYRSGTSTWSAVTVGTGLSFSSGTLAFSGGGGVSDGDKGDITVSSSGTAWAIDAGAVTYAKMQDVSATSRVLGRKTSGAGNVEECTLSEVLDFIGSAAQGDILYRGSSGWARLPAGTSGQFLKTQGTGADVMWDTPSGGGGSSRTEGTLAAAGSNQGDAAAITTDAVDVSGADGTKGVILPNTTAGIIVVRNSSGSSSLKVYPPSGADLGAGTNTAEMVLSNTTKAYYRVKSTLWKSAVLL